MMEISADDWKKVIARLNETGVIINLMIRNMKSIYAQLEKIKKETLLLYALIIVNVIGWGLLFYLKLADYMHGIGIEIGKALGVV